MAGDPSQFDLFGNPLAPRPTSRPAPTPAPPREDPFKPAAPSPADLAPRAPRPPAPVFVPVPLDLAPVPIVVPAPSVVPAAAPFSSGPRETPQVAGAVLSVSELTFQLKGAVEGRFAKVAVLGEVSNCKRQSSGHLYFTLKDDGACVQAVMWKLQAQRLAFEVRDGLQLCASGRIEIYGPHGKYQLIAERLEPVGAGALALAFDELKRKLEAEGLFAPTRKRKLPFLPRCIGVVTSATGAALRDFLRVLHLRYPGLPVLVAPARVQGDGAAAEVAEGLRRLVRHGEAEVIVLCRGGGSMEDLWAFNDERLARAIAASPVPVVSAVGHEIDFTIADFVADRRAATPTAAAELVAPIRRDLGAALVLWGQRLGRGLAAQIQGRRQGLLRQRLRLGDPLRRVGERRLRLADLEDRLAAAGDRLRSERAARLQKLSDRLQQRDPRAALAAQLRALHGLSVALERAASSALSLEARRARLLRADGRLREAMIEALRARGQQLRLERARLDAISPQRVFERGYSLTRSLQSGELVRRADQVVPGEAIEVTVGLREQGGELVEERLRARVE